MKLFVPFDFSPSSEMALYYAMYLQKLDGSSIYVLHVMSPQVILPSGLTIGYTEEQTENLAINLRAKVYQIAALYGVELQYINTDVQLGTSISDQILTQEEKKYDLIIMGTHDQENIFEKIMGSVSNSILKHSNTPVLFVHSSSPMPHKINKTLFAIDEKTNIKDALDFFSEFNKNFGSQTDFIHFRKNENDLDSQYDSILDSLYLHKEVNFSFNIEAFESNDTIQNIAEVVMTRNYDLLVLVHSNYSILKTYFGKSFSSEALHKTLIPALIFKSSKKY